jgi:hypothetical protein
MMKGRSGIHPSEDIPPGIERTGLPAQRGLARALAAVAVNQDFASFVIEDRLDPFFGHPRMVADCENRSWGYRTRIAPRQTQGIKICFKPVEATTMILTETAAMGLVQGAEAALRAEFAHYQKGGVLAGMTDNGLPPGMMTLAEWRIQEEARKAALSEGPEGVSLEP